MTARSTRRCLLSAAALAATGALLLTGCGDQTEGGAEDGGKSAKSSDAPLFDKLPEQYQDSGVVKVGSDIAYAPIEFKESGKTVGVDPDVAAAIGKQLGVRFELQNGKFDNLITSLQSKRIDVIMSAMSDTKDRQEGMDEGKKVGDGVDFVDYFNAGTSILVQKGNPKKISSLDDLCGRTVALQRGTTSEEVGKGQQKKCKDAGKPGLKLQTFDTDPEALLRLKQGASAADLNDFPVAAYNAQTSGGGDDFEVVGDQIEAGPYGVALRKSDTQLRDAVKEAMDAVIKNGDYTKILEKWNVTEGAVSEATVNGGS